MCMDGALLSRLVRWSVSERRKRSVSIRPTVDQIRMNGGKGFEKFANSLNLKLLEHEVFTERELILVSTYVFAMLHVSLSP